MTFSAKSQLSALFLGSAVVLGGASEMAVAQDTSPTTLQLQAGQQTGSSQLFVRDMDFELKMLDYQTRRLVQQMLDDPDQYWYSKMNDLTDDFDDPRKAQYLASIIEQLIVNGDPSIREHGADWARMLIPGNVKHKSIAGQVSRIASALALRAEKDPSVDVRSSAINALSSIAMAEPSLKQLALNALLKAADDQDSDVRAQVARTLVDVGGAISPGKVRMALEKLANDSDYSTSYYGNRGLQDLDELEAQNQTGPNNTIIVQPVPRNFSNTPPKLGL